MCKTYYRGKMAFVTCFVILLSLAKPKAASQPPSITGCTLMAKQPENTLVSCLFDRKLNGYTRCFFYCRAGYSFEGKHFAYKDVLCKNGVWLTDNLRNCVAPQEEVLTSSCLSKPKSPENSFTSCKFSKRLMKYTKCNFNCRAGYFFQDGTDEKTSVCRNDGWLPMNHGDCLADDTRTVTLTSTSNSCSSRPHPPLNSYDYCIFDKQEQCRGYRKCNYYCKSGYHFYSNVSRITQYCLGGSWETRRARDCLAEKIEKPPCWKNVDGPKNSFTFCTPDSNYVGYSECRYECKAGYYFHGDVYWRTQVCTNGWWKPNQIGTCVDESQRYSNTAYECSTPNTRRKTTVSCLFSESLGMYTTCNFTCNEGYAFWDAKRVKIQDCVDEKWKPRSIGHCDYNINN